MCLGGCTKNKSIFFFLIFAFTDILLFSVPFKFNLPKLKLPKLSLPKKKRKTKPPIQFVPDTQPKYNYKNKPKDVPKPAPSPDGRPSTKPKKPKFHKKTGSVKDPGIVKLKNLFNEFGDRQLFTGTAGVSFNIFSQKK